MELPAAARLRSLLSLLSLCSSHLNRQIYSAVDTLTSAITTVLGQESTRNGESHRLSVSSSCAQPTPRAATDSKGNTGAGSIDDAGVVISGLQKSKVFSRRAQASASHGPTSKGPDLRPLSSNSTVERTKGEFVEALAGILNGDKGAESMPDSRSRGRHPNLVAAKGRNSRGATRSYVVEQSAPEPETVMLQGRSLRRHDEAVVAASVGPEEVLGNGIGLHRENRYAHFGAPACSTNWCLYFEKLSHFNQNGLYCRQAQINLVICFISSWSFLVVQLTRADNLHQRPAAQ